jgi:hypothetical protein
MPDLSSGTYSEIDASNNQAAPNGMPEGMPPSGVNDAWRAGMGALKRAYDRDHAGSWCSVGGSGNNITLTYAAGPAAYVQGEKFAFKAIAANSGATTINVNGLGAVNLFKRTPTGPAAMSGGEIQLGDIIEAEFDGTQLLMLELPSSIGNFTGGTLTATTTMSGAAFNEASASIASAATLAIGAAPANYLQVSGTTTITAFDTAPAGACRLLRFLASLTLTNNAAIILPGGANITTQAGDVAKFVSAGGGVWVCAFYTKANGSAVDLATKPQMQAATDAAAVVTPAQLQNHPGVAKAWVLFNGTGAVGSITPIASYNIASVTKNATGDYTVAFSVPFSTSNYVCAAVAGNASNNQVLVYGPINAPSASSFRLATSDTASQVDRSLVGLSFFGNQ